MGPDFQESTTSWDTDLASPHMVHHWYHISMPDLEAVPLARICSELWVSKLRGQLLGTALQDWSRDGNTSSMIEPHGTTCQVLSPHHSSQWPSSSLHLVQMWNFHSWPWWTPASARLERVFGFRSNSVAIAIFFFPASRSLMAWYLVSSSPSSSSWPLCLQGLPAWVSCAGRW